MIESIDIFSGKVDPFVTTLVVLLTDKYTAEWFTWDIETVRLEVEDDYRIKLRSDILDKIAVGQLLMTTDLFYKSAPEFIHFCNVMNGDYEYPGVFNPADAYEVAWGVAEAELLEPPEEEPLTAFSTDILEYMKVVLKQSGALSPPDSLSFINTDELTGKSLGQLSADEVLYKAAYDEAQEEADSLNEYVNQRTYQLVEQLSQIHVKNGDLQVVVRAAKEKMEPGPEQFIIQ